jgi:hypothetical protein
MIKDKTIVKIAVRARVKAKTPTTVKTILKITVLLSPAPYLA